jgi:tripartite-type tricarboxylate transporter receptor subunit TctC
MAEFLAVAKAQKPPYLYASAGNGSLNHLLGEMLNKMAGLQLGHVPYKGVAPALTDVLGGQIPMAFASLPSCIQHIRAGRLRALGVSSPKRSPALADVPAIGESVPGYAGELWVGLFSGAAVPKSIIQKLATDVAAVNASAEVLEKYTALGVQKLDGGPDELGAMLKRDLTVWAPIVKSSGASVD